MNIKSKELIGLPVISLAEGQQLGTIKALLIDSEQKSISAIIVSVSTLVKETRILPYNKVHSVGADAVTVASASALQRGSQQQLAAHLNSRMLSGTKVLSDRGNNLGVVKDVIIDTLSGSIVHLEISTSIVGGIMGKTATLSAEYMETMGKDVIVAAAAGEKHLVYNANPIPEKLKTVSSSTFTAVESTWAKTKDLTNKVKVSFLKKEQEKAPTRALPQEESSSDTSQSPK